MNSSLHEECDSECWSWDEWSSFWLEGIILPGMIFSKKNVKVFVTNISKHQKIIFLYFYAGIAFLGIAGKKKVIKK